jgi:hypothetical protein
MPGAQEAGQLLLTGGSCAHPRGVRPAAPAQSAGIINDVAVLRNDAKNRGTRLSMLDAITVQLKFDAPVASRDPIILVLRSQHAEAIDFMVAIAL